MYSLFKKIFPSKIFISFIVITGVCSFAGISFAAGLHYDASTSSSIGNAAPVITVTPSDGNSSLANKINQGSNITFTAIAKDVNGDQYYLAICKTDAIAAGNNAAPTCPGGMWAVSSATNSDAQATANHTVTGSDGTVNNWYAFVCDKVGGGGACTPANGHGNRGFAEGIITFSGIPAEGATLIVDGVTYEFDTAGNGVTGGNTAVNTSTAQTPAECAGLLAAAESGANSSMTAKSTAVYVFADTAGSIGNGINMAKAGDTGNVITLSGANLTGGNDGNASPFYTNLAGTFGTVVVTDTGDSSSIDPGDTLKFKLPQGTVTATAGSNVNMYICSSSTTGFNYSTNTCTGGSMICSATNVNPTSQDAICQESGNNLVPIPTGHGIKYFYVYVEDNADLGAIGTNQQSYNVMDVRPVLVSYPSYPQPGSLTAGGSIPYTFTVSLTDNNGDGDVTNVKGILFDKSAVTHSCAANDNNCYIKSSCTLSGVDGDNALLATCALPSIWFNANASNWDIEAVATDGTGDEAFADGGYNLTIGALSALDVPEGSIAYGSVAIGYVSAKTTTTIANMGNQALDISLSGSPMTSGSNSIPVNMQEWYHTNTDFNWSSSTTDPGPYTLVSTANQGCTLGVDCGDAQGCLNRNILVRGSDHTSTATNESIYWKLKIPETQAIGSYSGTNTFSAEIHGQCAGGKSY
jgi:hypothetical protein